MSQKSFIVYYEDSKCKYICYNKDIGIKKYSSLPSDKYNCFSFIKYDESHNDESFE